MARIPQHFIDELLSRTDIVSVIEPHVPLKRAGHEYKARCPFHEEKTPSFTVSPQKQFYHCFGCGAHGTAISFLMEYEHLDFREAVSHLAGLAGLEIPEEAGDGQETRKLDPLFAALVAADRFYRRCLRESREPVDYLKGRGITGEIAKAYGLGYAPPGWENVKGRVDDERAAVAAGLLIEKDNGRRYDRFRNRIMFPIRDNRGRTIGFGGRAMPDDAPNAEANPAKYLNSPETPLFHKGRYLYGLFEARQALRDIPRMFVVEGYMDVIALAQHGFHNAVATLGTATTPEHLRALFRLCDEVVFCFDGDTAGRRAAWRALERALPEMRGTRRVRFLFMPEGEDPDSLVRGDNGGERFHALADDARPASQVLLDGLTEGVDLNTPDGRSRLVEKARPYVSMLPPEAFRLELIREIAGRTGTPASDLETLYASVAERPREPAPSARRTAPAETPSHGIRMTRVRRALQLLMDRPGLADNVKDLDALRASPVTGVGVLAETIEFFQINPNLPIAALWERQRGQATAQAMQRLATEPVQIPEESREQVFDECIADLVAESAERGIRQRYNELMARQDSGELTAAEREELNRLLADIRAGQRR